MSDYTLKIAGVDREVRRGSLRLLRRANVRPTLEAEIQSTDGSIYIPTNGQAVDLQESAVSIFLGRIDHPSTGGIDGEPDDKITTRIDCVDNNALADDLYVHDTFPGGTVEDFRDWIVTMYLGAKGVTGDPSQTAGPTLPALKFEYKSNKKVSDALTDVAQAAKGWSWNIDDLNQLLIAPPGVTSAPFDIIDGDSRVIGDVTLDETSEQFGNRIIIVGSAKEILYGKDDFTSQTDGSQVTFQLMRTPTGPFAPLPNAGVVWVQADAGYYVAETFGLGSATWIYDPATNSITDMGDAGPVMVTTYRQFPLPSLRPMWIIYHGTTNGFATADDLVSQAGPRGVVEKVIVSDLLDTAACQALADSELIKAVATPDTVVYETVELGLLPGQLQNIVEPLRGISGDFLIQQVETRDQWEQGDDDLPLLRHRVTAVSFEPGSPESGVYPGVVGDLYSLWAADRTSTPNVDTGTGIALPSPPYRSIQFENAGAFGGNALALIDYDGTLEPYGFPDLPATASFGVTDQSTSLALAIYNESLGKEGAMTWTVRDNGDVYVQLNAGNVTGGSGEWLDFTRGGGREIDATDNIGLRAGSTSPPPSGALQSNKYILLSDAVIPSALFTPVMRITGDYTIDANYDVATRVASDGSPDLTLIHCSASNHTWTLPDLSSAGARQETSTATVAYRRHLFLINGYDGGTLTLDPFSTQQIANQSNVVLGPGAAVHITNYHAFSGTGVMWYLAGAVGAVTVGGGSTVAAAGSDGDVQYAISGLLAASSTFNFDPTGKRLHLTTDHTDYGTGTVFAIYGSPGDVTPASTLILLDFEPGYDAAVTAAVGVDIEAFYINPKFTTAASGTHGFISGTMFDPSNMVDGGATSPITATVRILSEPSFGSSRYALFVDSGTGYIPYHITEAHQFPEQGSPPATPPSNTMVLYAEDNGSGKTRLMAKYADGSTSQVTIQP